MSIALKHLHCHLLVFVSLAAAGANDCIVAGANLNALPEPTRVGPPVKAGVSVTKSPPMGMFVGGGTIVEPTPEEAHRRRIVQAIRDRDLEEFIAQIPAEAAERAAMVKKHSLTQTAFRNGALAIVRQLLAWNRDAVRSVPATERANIAGELASQWHFIRESVRNSWPVKNPPTDADYAELYRLLLADDVRIEGSNHPALSLVASIPESRETNLVAGWLLDRGASIERYGAVGASALSRAAEQRNEALVLRMMAERNPSQEALDEALARSPWREPTRILERLLEAGASTRQEVRRFGFDFEPAFRASLAYRFHRERGPMLLAIRYRADPNVQRDPVNSALMTVIHDHELMEGLLALGAKPDYREVNGDTALGMAIRTPTFVARDPGDDRPLAAIDPATDPKHRAESVALLLKYGADANLVVKGEFTPVMTTRNEDGAIIEALLDRGGRVVIPARTDEYFRRMGTPVGPVTWSLMQRNGTLASALVKRGASANGDDCGALYYALAGGHARAARLLVESHANTRFRYPKGEVARLLLVAAAGGSVDSVRLVLDSKLASLDETRPLRLVAAAADVAAILSGFSGGGETGGGENALMTAVSSGHREVVKELLDRGIDVRHRTGAGLTAMDFAGRHDYKERDEIRVLLRARGL